MEGWIKLHRQIKNHWLWKSDNRFKWWIDILLTVNHSDSKVLIKGTLIECKRGQSIRSLESWAREWNISKGAVRDFFKLLQSEEMLATESLTFTTRITVCKYEDYQTEVHAEKTQKKRKGNAEETQALPKQEYKEEQEEKEEKTNNIKFDFKQSVIDLGVEEQIILDWLIVRKNKKASNTETAFNKLKREIEKSKLPANECVKIAVERNWQGFEYEWIKNIKIDNVKQKPKLSA